MNRTLLTLSVLGLCACSSTSKGPPASSGGHSGPGDEGGAAQADSGGGNGLNPGGKPRPCPSVGDASDAGEVGPKSLSEVSGLTASPAHPGVLWLHNDSGDEARIFATRDDGVALGVVEVEDAKARDWEDIASGPGPVEGKTYLFIADIGDNTRERANVQIYRIEEPELDASGKPKVSSVPADVIEVKYEKGPRDAETLLVDPLTGDLYIVEKNLTDSGVYRIPSPAAGSSRVTTKAVAHIDLVMSTGGGVLPAGDGFAIRTYLGISYWPRDPGLPLEAAFEGEPCSLQLTSETQGEAFGFSSDGDGYFTVSEGKSEMLHAYRFK